MVYVLDLEFLYEDKFAAIGDSVTIPCHGSNTMPVMWQYKSPVQLNALELFDGYQLIRAYMNKCTINGSTYDMTIHKVEADDAGEYWCVEDEGFGVKHVTKLFVTGNMLLLLHGCETGTII